MKCAYCRKEMKDSGPRRKTRDHVVPKSKGGPDAASNIVDACYACNQDKADLSVGEWYGWLIVTGDARAEVLCDFVDFVCDVDRGLAAQMCAEAGLFMAKRKLKTKIPVPLCADNVRNEALAAAAARVLRLDQSEWSVAGRRMSFVVCAQIQAVSIPDDVAELVDRIRIVRLRIERNRIDCRPRVRA